MKRRQNRIDSHGKRFGGNSMKSFKIKIGILSTDVEYQSSNINEIVENHFLLKR